MKSLDEALGVVTIPLDTKNPQGAVQAYRAYQDSIKRYDSLIQDITSNPLATEMVKAFRQMNNEGILPGDDLVMTAIINGIIIGIEMTKVDWIPPDLESERCRDCGGLTAHESTCQPKGNRS